MILFRKKKFFFVIGSIEYMVDFVFFKICKIFFRNGHN